MLSYLTHWAKEFQASGMPKRSSGCVSIYVYFQLTTWVFPEPSEYGIGNDHLLLCGLLPTSPATLGPERRRGGKTQLTGWSSGQCCLHMAQGGPRRPELAARPPLRGSLGMTGPWGVTGDAGPWHSSSRDPYSVPWKHLTYPP